MTNRVEELSWDAVAARIAGGALAVLPVGAGAKQHGWHLPMGADRLQAEWLAGRLAERVDALVWPTLTYGHYPNFVAYAGSCSLSSPLFEATVRELVEALIGYGARVAVLNVGISTIAPIDKALVGLGDVALHLPVYQGARYRESAAQCATQIHGGHADELETAIMLAIAPESVAMARAEAGRKEPPGPGPMQPNDPAAPNYSRSGSIGDAHHATPAMGHVLLAAMMDDIMASISGWLRRASGAG